jgi:hypothetical protein
MLPKRLRRWLCKDQSKNKGEEGFITATFKYEKHEESSGISSSPKEKDKAGTSRYIPVHIKQRVQELGYAEQALIDQIGHNRKIVWCGLAQLFGYNTLQEVHDAGMQILADFRNQEVTLIQEDPRLKKMSDKYENMKTKAFEKMQEAGEGKKEKEEETLASDAEIVSKDDDTIESSKNEEYVLWKERNELREEEKEKEEEST